MRWNACENKEEKILYYEDSLGKLLKIQYIVDEVQLVEDCYKAIKKIKEVLGSEE